MVSPMIKAQVDREAQDEGNWLTVSHLIKGQVDREAQDEGTG